MTRQEMIADYMRRLPHLSKSYIRERAIDLQEKTREQFGVVLSLDDCRLSILDAELEHSQ